MPVFAEEPRGAGEQRVEGGQRVPPGREEGSVGLRESAAHGIRRAGGANDRTKLLGGAGASRALEGLERGLDVVEAGERQAAVADQEGGGLGGLGEKAGDAALLERGNQRQNRRPSGRRSCQGRNEPKDDAELERFPVGAASVRGD